MPNQEAPERIPEAAAPEARPDETAATVRERLRRLPVGSWDLLCVVDASGRLLGTVTPGALLCLPDDAALGPAAEPVPQVRPGTSQEEMASIALERNASAVAVTDADGRPAGIAGPRALMAILRREHVEDLHRLAGISRETEQARAALEDAPVRRVRHRLPWLLVGLAGCIAATGIMANFEEELGRRPAIAFFVPGLIYLADAIGTQSEAIAVAACRSAAVPRCASSGANCARAGSSVSCWPCLPSSASGAGSGTCASHRRWGWRW